jgi:hypothetical protein
MVAARRKCKPAGTHPADVLRRGTARRWKQVRSRLIPTRCGYPMPIHFNGRFQRSNGRPLLRDDGRVHERSRIAGRDCTATCANISFPKSPKDHV